MTDRTYTYASGRVNQLASITDAVAGVGATQWVEHDANGNITARRVGAAVEGPFTEQREFVYDRQNQLAEVAAPAADGSVALAGRYQYDFEGRRSKRIGADGMVQYVHDGDDVVAELASVGSPTSYFRGLGLIALRSAGSSAFMGLCAMGSVANVTGATGGIESRYSYDAWGETAATTEPGSLGSKTRFTFTGYQTDPESSLHFAKSRYLDAGLGRFLTQDSHLGELGQPASLHLYAYAQDRPTFFVDPTGHIAALSNAKNRIDALGEEIVNAGVDVANYAGQSQIARLAGVDTAIAKGAGQLSGLTSVVGDIVGLTNAGTNVLVLLGPTDSQYAHEAANETFEVFSAIEKGVAAVRADGWGIASGMASNAGRTCSEQQRVTTDPQPT